jgi:hypothetical protein
MPVFTSDEPSDGGLAGSRRTLQHHVGDVASSELAPQPAALDSKALLPGKLVKSSRAHPVGERSKSLTACIARG